MNAIKINYNRTQKEWGDAFRVATAQETANAMGRDCFDETEKKVYHPQYIGSYKVLDEITDLPSVGDIKRGAICDKMVISVETVFPKEKQYNTDEYIFYAVKMVDTESIRLYDDFEVDTAKLLYAIKKDKIKIQ